MTTTFGIVEVGELQKNVNLIDLVKSFQMSNL